MEEIQETLPIVASNTVGEQPASAMAAALSTSLSESNRETPLISVVLPVYNESDNLPELYQRLAEVFQQEKLNYELVFVDDGSRDSSAELIRQFHQGDPGVKLVRLSRNFGHQTAISAGLFHARGDAVIMMDTDLQDSPEDLPLLINTWRQGYEVVYAIRNTRKEGFFKQTAYRLFYRLLKQFSEIDIPLDSGDFSLIDRKIVTLLNQFPERGRFLRGLRAWVGFRQIGIPVNRDSRFAGKPKYSIRHLIRLALSGLLSFSVAPLHLASTLGFIVSVSSFLAIFVVIYCRLFTTLSIPGFAATASMLLFLGGVQLLTIGILGEYIGKIYDEVKHRPLFLVSEKLGLD